MELKRLSEPGSTQHKEIASPCDDDAKPSLATYESYSSTTTDPTTDTQQRRSRRKCVIGGVVVLVAILSVAVILSTTTSAKKRAPVWTPPTRVRRSWKTYTEADKQHYLSAVQLAMEKGYHYRFVQIHTTQMSRMTAHGACPFLLWHRRFILGYENMLRSLAPQFADLTIPYWNYFEDTNRQLASDVQCDSLESCSLFLRDMGGGGLTDGRVGDTMTIEHLDLTIGTCVSKGIAGHACNHPNGTASGQCRNCILRGKWDNPRKIVAALGPDLLSVLNVFNATANDEAAEGANAVLSHEIETTFHNAIHNTLNATMRYTSSPFDPVFMGHHGLVDLVQLIFNKCQYVANASVVLDWNTTKRNTRFDVFTACDVDDSNRVYNYTAFGNETIPMTYHDVVVTDDPFMKQFFSGEGNTYADMASAEDLSRANRYTYLIDPYLEHLLASHRIQCPPYLFEPKNSTTASRRLNEEIDTDRQAALRLVDTLATCGNEIAVEYPTLNYQQRIEQEGLIKCLVVEAKAGGVIDDYDDAFRAMMKMKATDTPYCVKLLRRYRRGDLALLVSQECLVKYGEQTSVNLLALSQDVIK